MAAHFVTTLNDVAADAPSPLSYPPPSSSWSSPPPPEPSRLTRQRSRDARRAVRIFARAATRSKHAPRATGPDADARRPRAPRSSTESSASDWTLRDGGADGGGRSDWRPRRGRAASRLGSFRSARSEGARGARESTKTRARAALGVVGDALLQCGRAWAMWGAPLSAMGGRARDGANAH